VPLGEHLHVVGEIDEQDVLAEVLERRARVAREPVSDDVSLGFHSLPLCFHIERQLQQAQIKTCRSAAVEISQLRSGWNNPAKIILSSAMNAGRTWIFHYPAGTGYVLGREPGTTCRVNFQLSLRDGVIATRRT